MADGQNDAQATDEVADGTATPDAPKAGETPPWGEDFDAERAWKTIQNLRAKEKRIADLEREAKAREDAEKTEAQRLADRLAEVEQKAKDAERALIRTRVAAKHGLPDEVAALIHADTEEDFEAKAAALAEFAASNRAPAADLPGKPKPRLVPGDSAGDDGGDDFDPNALAAKILSRDY